MLRELIEEHSTLVSDSRYSITVKVDDFPTFASIISQKFTINTIKVHKKSLCVTVKGVDYGIFVSSGNNYIFSDKFNYVKRLTILAKSDWIFEGGSVKYLEFEFYYISDHDARVCCSELDNVQYIKTARGDLAQTIYYRYNINILLDVALREDEYLIRIAMHHLGIRVTAKYSCINIPGLEVLHPGPVPKKYIPLKIG